MSLLHGSYLRMGTVPICTSQPRVIHSKCGAIASVCHEFSLTRFLDSTERLLIGVGTGKGS